jgi:hypothetical protein
MEYALEKKKKDAVQHMPKSSYRSPRQELYPQEFYDEQLPASAPGGFPFVDEITGEVFDSVEQLSDFASSMRVADDDTQYERGRTQYFDTPSAYRYYTQRAISLEKQRERDALVEQIEEKVGSRIKDLK